MSINDSCPCYPRYPGMPQAPIEPFHPPPIGLPPPAPEDLIEVPLTLLNPGFNDAVGGNHTAPDNWTVTPPPNGFWVDNGASGPTPYEGPFSGGGRDVGGATAISTAIDLIAAGIMEASIDTGQRRINVSAQYAATGGDSGSLGFIFLDDSDEEIERIRSNYLPGNSYTWTFHEFWALVPATTRKVQVWLKLHRTGGDDLNVYYDDLAVKFEDVSP